MDMTRRDKVVIGLFFLFPLCGNLVKSWYSSIFILLGLLSLFYIRRGWPQLEKGQKLAYGVMVAFFAAFFVKACLLGWEKPEVKALGIEIYFLFLAPMMCMTKVLPQSKKALLYGAAVSLPIMLGQAAYEVLWLDQFRLVGVNNPLRVAAAALVAMFCVSNWFILKQRYAYAAAAFLCGVLVVLATHGRASMLAVLVMSFLMVLIYLRSHLQRVVAITLVVGSAAGVFYSSDTLQQRFSESNDVVQYIAGSEKGAEYTKAVGSWVIHYMMLEASWELWQENPVLGVGRRRYIEHMEEYAEEKRVHPVLAQGDLNSPHTIWAEIAVSKGLVGVLSFLGFICTLLAFSWQQKKQGILLAMFICCVLLTGVTEAWWVIKTGFVAMLMIFVAVLSNTEEPMT